MYVCLFDVDMGWWGGEELLRVVRVRALNAGSCCRRRFRIHGSRPMGRSARRRPEEQSGQWRHRGSHRGIHRRPEEMSVQRKPEEHGGLEQRWRG